MCKKRAFLKWSRVDSIFTYLSLIGAAVHLDKALRREREDTRAARLPADRLPIVPSNPQRRGFPLQERRDYLRPSETSSVRAAIMKSFRCKPPILCVHQVTVTLPHSVNSAGWCPSFSACSPTLLVKASAWAKLRNLNTRSKRLVPSRSTTCHSGTCGRNFAISASVSVGSSPRQAVHLISHSSLMVSSFLFPLHFSGLESLLQQLYSVPSEVMR